MYRYATGWLGWPPDVALKTPFPLIQLALDGKVDFLLSTTPGAKKPKKKAKPGEVGAQLRAFFSSRKAAG